jgi:hypothetical protein
MTSQPGAGGDAVPDLAKAYMTWAHDIHAKNPPPQIGFTEALRWIATWSDTVAAAVRQAEAALEYEMADETDRETMRSLKNIREDARCQTEAVTQIKLPNWTARVRTTPAVRSALTHRDEKEGG